jgi:peptidoglycan/LPS O-acetylase OafA/YrhL
MRAVFAFAVILTHWSLNLPLSPIGWESMQMFFILSGYLITSVLLSEREKAYERTRPNFWRLYERLHD